jgi:transcription termination factor Rho
MIKPTTSIPNQESQPRRRKLSPRTRGKPAEDARREDPRPGESIARKPENNAEKNSAEKNSAEKNSVEKDVQTIDVNEVSDERAQDIQGLAVSGVLELHPQGYGFLRDGGQDYRPTPNDAFVPAPTIEQLRLRPGNFVRGVAHDSGRGGPRVSEVVEVDGLPAKAYRQVKHFDELTPIVPRDWLRLETGPEPLSTRVIDLLAPLGKGQRALLVAPPRSGKTILLQQLANAVSTNYPDVDVFVLLVDERPEEVTEFRRHVRGEVLASSLDRDVEGHVRLSRLAVDRCKRLAERGRDVFLLIDSLTRMARAFNKWVGGAGRTMSGGLDIRALDVPKKLFASARAFEEGGSLTIAATALIETGSRMDDVIFEEFKGTGNMELVLDRQLADRRVWPAIDVTRTGTRHEELLLDPSTLHASTMLRRTLASMHPVDGMERLTAQLAKHKSNAELVSLIGGRAA